MALICGPGFFAAQAHSSASKAQAQARRDEIVMAGNETFKGRMGSSPCSAAIGKRAA
ncbi:MAG TPA: hypothetical protein VGN52_06865 [Burkholderiales bacterium]|jgi:hypothetical protein